jgi:hypothetical protein
MKRKARAERIGIAFFDDSLSYRADEEQWERIEQAYGRNLSPELRVKIRKAATTFIIKASTERAAALKSDVGDGIRAIASAVTTLVDLFDDGTAPADNTNPNLFARDRIQRFFERFQAEESSSLRALIADLRTLRRACEQAETDLATEKGFEEGEAWGGLIFRLTVLLDEEGMPTGISNDGRSAFTLFFRALQETLPEDDRRHERAGGEAFARAMNRARTEARKRERDRKKRHEATVVSRRDSDVAES